jgi:protein-S-isoprenylcysteine O-methyltransferase Ste14
MEALVWRRRRESSPAARKGRAAARGLDARRCFQNASCRRWTLHLRCQAYQNHLDIDHGIYRFTRNPMYLGLVILTLGIAVWVGAWPMFIAPIAVFATANWVHIPFEEDKMHRQFGATYDGYVRRVRRWV